MEISPIRRLVQSSDSRGVRWGVRLGVLLGIVLIGHCPYDHTLGGDARLVPFEVRGLRAQIASEVLEVHVRQGDRVEAGQLVATLAARTEKAELEKARAQLARERAQLELLHTGARDEEIAAAAEEVQLRRIELQFAQTEYDREKRLAADSVTSAADLERAQRNRDSRRQLLRIAEQNLSALQKGARDQEIRAAAAEVERLEAEVRHQEELVEQAEIRSPISGLVVTSNLAERVGQFVQPGELIAVVHDLSRLRAAVSAEQGAAVEIEPGMEAEIRLYGIDGALIEGFVHSKGSEAMDPRDIEADNYLTTGEANMRTMRDRASTDRLVEVRVDLDDNDYELKPGMTGYGKIVVSNSVLWRALWRPVRRFLLVDIWSWLP